MFTFLQPKRQVVIEHNITSNIDGEKFAPVVIDGSFWGSDFDTFNGDTLIHDDGEYGKIPVTFHQTFLTTRMTDEQLLRKYKNQ
jgi:hypothetical protein